MKTFFASAMLMAVSMFGATQAQAYLPVAVQNYFTPQQVTFSVENFYAYPIVCQGRFFALTASNPEGVWLDFAIGPVFAGTSGFATMTPPFVYQGDYFVSIPQTVAYCNFY